MELVSFFFTTACSAVSSRPFGVSTLCTALTELSVVVFLPLKEYEYDLLLACTVPAAQSQPQQFLFSAGTRQSCHNGDGDVKELT